MAEVYVTLGEAAELEGVKYKTMAQRLSRKKETFVTKTEKSETGGKDVVLVAVSSLSKQARNAWKEREKLKSFTEEFPDKKEDEQKPEVPWYVNTDVDWYIENYKERYYKAVELGNVVRKFLQYDEGDRTKYAEEFAQKYLGKGQRTLYRYTKAYLEASAWADKLEKEDGAGREFFKVLCLCRKPKETGCFPSIKPEVKQVIKNIWFNEDFARNQGTREMLYEKLTAIANINKWEKIPSYQTVTRYISYLMEDEGMRNAWFLASRGTREYKNKVMVKGSRDTKGLQVMQIVMGDEHTFDCWVSYKQPNGKVIAIKPHLAAWVDMRSRVIMGDVMCKDANSDILKQSLLKMIYSEPGGVPEYLYIDNGKDYTAKTMTGRDRNDRSGMSFDNETMGFYKSIGIKDDHRALPYEPWSKGQIERFFRTVCNKFTRWMKSYTGTLTGSKTSDKVDKDIKRMLERGELLTLEEFYEKWHEWLTTVYMHTEHSGLKKMGETYKKPYDCFMNEDRYFKAAPPKSYATMLMMKSENVLVRNIGITKWGYEYRSDELCDYIGRKVDIKYDPDDMAVLYVFDQKGKEIMIKDDMMKLDRVTIKASFVDCEPQDVIRYVLACAGIEDYVLSDEHYGKKDLFVIDRKSGINTIAEVNSSWGIKNPFFFQKKVFYWGTKEEQKEIYVLEEGETILSLNKYGDLWEAETIAIPWIHHSQEVEVQHSKYSGIVTVEKTIVRSDDTGAVHMYIYFAGGEKDV